ncbi:MAG: zinc-binding dehydrogenase, partial [Solirubrobacteraceae bacterium]
MRAAQFSQFGGPEVLEIAELPDPHAAAGQIRVAVRAAGINPVDWKVRSGMMGGELPQTTGREAAGVVDEIGDQVSDVAVGDEVFGFVAGGGGAAEFALLEDYARIPPSLDFAAAAALPVAVETATRTLDALGVTEGQSVVINGAAGGVGQAAVQIARDRGARVIGTASEANHEFLRSLGAQATTYGDGLAERVRELAPQGVDAALD